MFKLLMLKMYLFQRRNHRANEYIHLVNQMLENAVDHCIKAAGHEIDTSTQKLLMKVNTKFYLMTTF